MCLVIKDLVTTGMSVLETVQLLNVVGLKVTDVGGVDIQRTRRTQSSQTLQKLRLWLNATLKLNYIVDVLVRHGKVTGSVFCRESYKSANGKTLNDGKF